jgi:hypothetical protein
MRLVKGAELLNTKKTTGLTTARNGSESKSLWLQRYAKTNRGSFLAADNETPAVTFVTAGEVSGPTEF